MKKYDTIQIIIGESWLLIQMAVIYKVRYLPMTYAYNNSNTGGSNQKI